MEKLHRNRKVMLCGICMALMLAGCGFAEDKVQKVEQEDIGEEFSPEEKDTGAEEESEEKAPEEEPGNTEAEEQTESKDPETAKDAPAVVTIEANEQEYKEGEAVIMTASCDHVTAVVEGNEAATRAITAEFEKREQSFWEGVAESVEWAKEDTLVTDDGMSYSEECRYAAKRNDGRILSFSVYSGGFEGGAHGYYMEYGLNFDAKTGQVLAIADIAQDGAAFQEICVQEMLRQCGDLEAQGVLFEEEMIYPSLREVLEGKMEGGEWYFTEEGICFISNIYEIAPYAAGHFLFDIPYQMVNEALKEEYRGQSGI